MDTPAFPLLLNILTVLACSAPNFRSKMARSAFSDVALLMFNSDRRGCGYSERGPLDAHYAAAKPAPFLASPST